MNVRACATVVTFALLINLLIISINWQLWLIIIAASITITSNLYDLAEYSGGQNETPAGPDHRPARH